MPISGEQFDKTNRTPGQMLLDFLRDNEREAFSLEELVKVLSAQRCRVTAEQVGIMLDSLEYGGKVKSRVVDEMPYYRYSEVVGFKLI